jgi:uncharacterized protein (TIGR00661 family)
LQKIFIHKKILIVPLDWGLGHATRCVAMVRQLQQMGCEVIIASSRDQLILLQKEFPNLISIPVEGYNVHYSKGKRWLLFKILMQSPKILLSIRREHRWLKKIIAQLKIDAVISDNRYGLYTKKIPCVFITHQLQIKAPYKSLENFLRKINYSFIDRFNECWVPDYEGEINIAGSLSHPSKMPSVPVKFVGPLSRFSLINGEPVKKFKYLIIMSGPEPQRTIFEKKIFNIISRLKGDVMILRGKPDEEKQFKSFDNCTVINHLTTDELEKILCESEFVISRCGYTTVMEILSLRKKSILIPTPGQTEQEYLAERLMKQHWCYSCKQDDDLLSQINKAKEFEFKFPSFEINHLKAVIQDFLQKLEK